MRIQRTLCFTLFIVCSLALVSGSSGASAVESGSEIDLAAAAAHGLGTDVQVNWSGGDVGGKTTQSETSIRINPNTGTICAAYNDGPTGTGHSRSTDGGATFVDGGGFPDGPGEHGAKAAADPSLEWRAADGFFYFAAVGDKPGKPLSLWRSTDDCETFSFHRTITATLGADREMMAIDNNPDNYYGRFYLVALMGGIWVTHSDDGDTWAEPERLDAVGEADVTAPWPAVDPTTGDVYVAWPHWVPNYTGVMDIEIKRSTDGGVEWNSVTRPLPGAVTPRDFIATALCGRPALNGYIAHYTAPQIVVDRYSNLHIVYSYDPDGVGVGDVINVYYRRSTDRGATWGPEVRLNDDATLTDQWFPTVSVGPTGIVVATWYDRRNDPDSNYMYDYYKAISLDNGVTWGPNIRVSDVSSDLPPLLGLSKPCYHGDYDQQVQRGPFVYILWSDDRNIQNDYPDPDVWFEKDWVIDEVLSVHLPFVTSGEE